MAGGSQNPMGHVGSVDGTIPEAYGVDPSIAPGLPRPVGWRVALPDGTAAWDKIGVLDTDWVLLAMASGDVTGVAAGSGILVANPTGPVPTVSASYGASATDVAAASAAGTAATLSRSDHAHKGIFAVVAGNGVSVDVTAPASPVVAQTFGAAPPAVAAASAAGAANSSSRSDHTHAGVASITAGFGITVDATAPAAPVVNSIAAATPSTLETLLARSRLAFGAGDFAFDMDDLTTAVLASNWTVGGAPTVDTTHGPGVWAFPNVVNTFLVKPPATVVDPAVTPWHFAVRVRFPTALSAGEIFSFGLIKDGTLTDACIAGTRQASSATKFVFTNIKASASTHVLSTVSIDTTNFHKLEMWFDGTNVYGSVDGETPIVIVSAANAPATYLTPTNWLRATANVGGNAGLIDYIYSAAARTAT